MNCETRPELFSISLKNATFEDAISVCTMKLEKVTILNFKNIADAELEFPARVNCLVGDNGAGKTNVLDAIYFLSMCKSSQGSSDAGCIRQGEELFMLSGDYATDSGRREQIRCGMRRGQSKNFMRAGKEYERLGDHIGVVPVVIVSPSDAYMIHDPAEERRKYLNSLLSQSDAEYLAQVMRYNRLVSERNKLLKQLRVSSFEELLTVIDQQLVPLGEAICRKRAEAVATLAPDVARYYAVLSDDREKVELAYSSELLERPYAELLAEARQKDLINQYTTCGIHRDDVKMTIGGQPLKRYGSQGQQKSFLVALKLAQYVSMAAAKGEKPLLLLDDLFDKLDKGRVERLLGLVCGGEFGQVFITDCQKTHLQDILSRLGEPYTLTVVDGGKAERTDG